MAIFTESELDLLVVGGGITGACVAWDAALRGLRVGLIDRQDLGAGATANCLKIVHGGLRYLQHLDMRRMRESIGERSFWLRAAPHLVEPLPVVMPMLSGTFPPRQAFRAALALNDLLAFDRNRDLIPERRLPRSRMLTRRECVALVPELEMPDLSGAVHFHDALMYSPERLVLEVVNAARAAGALAAPYVELDGVVLRSGRVAEARLRDVLSDDVHQVRTRWIINAAGSWAASVADRLLGRPAGIGPQYSVALNFVTRQPQRAAAFTVSAGVADPDRVVKAGGRQLFVVPWRGQTLLGTAHLPLRGAPERFVLDDEHVDAFWHEVAMSRPELMLERDDVVLVHRGLLPVGRPGANGGIRLLKRPVIHDHAPDGARGALSVFSVKYTTARRVAQHVMDRIAAEDSLRSSSTGRLRLPGAVSGSFEAFRTAARAKYGEMVDPDVLEHLLRTYGAQYERILGYRTTLAEWDRRIVPGAPVIYAQLVHGAREELARTAEDLIWRRTEIGPRGLAGAACLARAQQALASVR